MIRIITKAAIPPPITHKSVCGMGNEDGDVGVVGVCPVVELGGLIRLCRRCSPAVAADESRLPTVPPRLDQMLDILILRYTE